MAGLLSDGVPACPICPFIVPSNSPDEAYELIYHIELNHPENGESPFFARDPSPPRHRSQSITPSDTGSISDQDRQPFDLRHLSAPGPNDEEAYVDCPANCGEVVHIRELEDHMDLHDDEDMILDDATGRNVSPSSTTRRSLSADPTRRIELVQSASSNSIPKSKHSASSSQKSRRVKRRKDSTLTALKNYFMGPPPKMTRTNNVKAKQGGTIRLGVSLD